MKYVWWENHALSNTYIYIHTYTIFDYRKMFILWEYHKLNSVWEYQKLKNMESDRSICNDSIYITFVTKVGRCSKQCWASLGLPNVREWKEVHRVHAPPSRPWPRSQPASCSVHLAKDIFRVCAHINSDKLFCCHPSFYLVSLVFSKRCSISKIPTPKDETLAIHDIMASGL